MSNIYPFLPLSLIVLFAIMIMVLEVFMTKHKELLAYISLGGVIISAISTAALWNKQQSPFRLSFFEEMFVIDNYSLFFYLLFLLCAGITIFTSVGYLRRENMIHG